MTRDARAAAAQLVANEVRRAIKRHDRSVKDGALVDPAQRSALVELLHELEQRASIGTMFDDPEGARLRLVGAGEFP